MLLVPFYMLFLSQMIYYVLNVATANHWKHTLNIKEIQISLLVCAANQSLYCLGIIWASCWAWVYSLIVFTIIIVIHTSAGL